MKNRPPCGEWINASTNFNIIGPRSDDEIERKLISAMADAMREYEAAAKEKYAPLADSITAMARACRKEADDAD